MQPENKGPLSGGFLGTLQKQVSNTSHDEGEGASGISLGEPVSKRNTYNPSQRKDLYQRRRFDPNNDVDVK